MKLYRYRPLNEFLFKELFYNEVYFASPEELNDPLDLNRQLDFYSQNDNEIKSLSIYLYMEILMWIFTTKQNNLIKEIQKLEGSKVLGNLLKEQFSQFKEKQISKEQFYRVISIVLSNHLSEENFKKFDIREFIIRQDKIINQFFNNSSVVCFSESCTDFLMWSHYASSHTGVCLEFEVDADQNDNKCKFTFSAHKTPDGEEREYTQDVQKVKYDENLTNMKIYDYLNILHNKDDFDLINLSKSRWHGYAHSIEDIFLQKLSPWSAEEEWRIVDVAFQNNYPEERIQRFSSNFLTGVYFGAKSSNITQNRIKNIFKSRKVSPNFHNCFVNGTKGVYTVPVE